MLPAALLVSLLLGAGFGRLTLLTPAASPIGTPPSVFLRIPYLMEPRTDAITVAWLTPPNVLDGTLIYGRLGKLTAPIRSSKLAQVDGTLNSVRLTHLSPGTRYEYLVTAAGQTVAGDFTTLPSQGTLQFTAVGDFGGGTAAEVSVVRLMQRQNPSFFVALGDNTYESGALPEMDRNVFPQFREFLSFHGAVWVLGKHDYATGAGVPTLTNFFMPSRNYSFDAGDVHFIILEADGSQGYAPGGTSYDFLRHDLASYPRARWKFAFFHSPAYSCGATGSTSWVDQYWIPLFDQYKVDAVFNAGAHDYESIKPDANGVHYFVAGMGGMNLMAMRHDCGFQRTGAANFFGDLLVRVSGSTIQVNAVKADGTVVDSVRWSKP